MKLEEQAKSAIGAWVNAVYKRDPALLDAVLAPEFQIMHADATTFDKAGYIGSSLPILEALPHVEDLVVTGSAELFVARYILIAKETRDGVAVEISAPRLSVFRKHDGKFLVVAHANFAALER